MREHPLFDEAARKRIEEAVRRAEAKSSAEIVPVVVDRSDAYPEAQDRGAIAALILATVVMWFAFPELPRWEFVLVQALALPVGWFAGAFEPLARLLIGRRALDSMARWRAEVAFREEGLTRTKGGTGVLVFASLFEHEVVILGDRPVHEKVGDAGWREAVSLLVGGIKANKPADGFVDAIDRLGEQLATHFPKGPDDHGDELPNRLTIR